MLRYKKNQKTIFLIQILCQFQQSLKVHCFLLFPIKKNRNLFKIKSINTCANQSILRGWL
ncbi:hypothetical protein NIES970_15840 [[Synechococcus] sp. NIES-970]|nr:hypothetical protein NIES970_15840 [[Synechococcus] sp. NIES-970]